MDAPANRFEYRLQVRYSDEDMNKHANHSAYARFLEDAKQALAFAADHPLSARAQRAICGLALEYRKESKALDTVLVCLSSRHSNALDVHMYCTSGETQGLILRGQCKVDPTNFMDQGDPASKL